MRTALFGDIHANLEALVAVLDDARSQNVSKFVCLGDIVGYNADPSACLTLVQELNCPTVKGNHDHDAGENHSLESMNPVAAAALEWTREQLDDDQRAWLKRLRMVRQVSEFSIVHSTLDQPAAWHYVTNRFDAMSSFAYQFTQLCFHGHTHVPKVYVKSDKVREEPPDLVAIEPKCKYFINVGSVGQPRDGDPRASYVILDLERRLITFRRVPYDVATTQRKIRDAGLPLCLAERLVEGR